MSKKDLKWFLVPAIVAFFGLVFANGDASAAYVNSYNITGHTDYTKADGSLGTTFHVTLNFGSDCPGCYFSGNMDCITPGAGYTTNETTSGHAIYGPYYDTTNYPNWGIYTYYIYGMEGYQSMSGTIYRPFYQIFYDEGAHTTISSYRWSGVGGASWLSDKSYTHIGDKLSATAAADDGYSISTFKINNTSYELGKFWGDANHSFSAGWMNYTIQSRATRNSFQGRARVSEGNSIGSSPTSTGFVNSNKTETLSMDSTNSGKNATFDLALKTTAGSGKTAYAVSGPSGTISNINPASPSAPSSGDNGTTLKMNNSNTATELIKPGNSKCYSVTFRPYGSLGNSDTRTAKACASAKTTTFKGKVSVTGDISNTTGFVDSNTRNVFKIPNCSNITGCKVSFKHEMQRGGSIGSTEYTVSRESNLTDSSSEYRIANVPEVTKGTFSTNTTTVSQEKSVRDPVNNEFTLYPGMLLCETIKFKPNNTGASDVYVTACAFAAGDAQPADTGNTAFLEIKQKNNNVDRYKDFTTNTIYAKPGDTIQYETAYYPRLQYAYYLVPEKLKINGNICSNTNTLPAGNAKNTYKLGLALHQHFISCTWNNAYDIIPGTVSKNDSNRQYAGSFLTESKIRKNYTFTHGDHSRHVQNSSYPEYKVTTGDVSYSLPEQVLTNNIDSVKHTPTQINFDLDGNSNALATLSFANAAKSVSFSVPYNYRTSVTTKLGSETYPAGETGSASAAVNVVPKGNSLTTNSNNEKYATITAPTKAKLVGFVPAYGVNPDGNTSYNGSSPLCNNFTSVLDRNINICNEMDINSGSTNQYNRNGKLEGTENETVTNGTTFNVPDLEAGTRFCVAVAIYPSTSGSDNNLLATGDDKWNISRPSCFTITKKPSMQVWGGGIYINNGASDVETSTSIKNNLKSINGYEYNIKSSNGTRVFGSWAEQALIATGNVKGLGSGASMGYSSYTNGLFPNPTFKNTASGNINPGGSYEESLDFCLRSPLSMANASGLKADGRTCKNANGFVGSISGSGSSNVDNDRNSIINTLINNGVSSKSTYCSFNGDTILGSTEGYGDNEGELRDKDCKATKTLPLGTTKIIHVKNKGNVTISSDLQYTSGPYNALSDIPKLIIYSTGNININCNVGRIDAVLIADGNVDTCPVEKDEDRANREYSNQLIINGAIIAKNLKLNRTYGAAAGVNSIIPAEIVKYDATLYLWGAREAEMGQSGGLTDAYTHELPPRY